MACQNFVVGSENYLSLALVNSVTEAPQAGATVNAVLSHRDSGLPVTGGAIAMPETATPGTYFGQFDDSLDVVAGERLDYAITAEAGGLTRVFRGEIPVSE